MTNQIIITPTDNYQNLDTWIFNQNCHKMLLVCDSSLQFQKRFISHLKDLERNNVQIITFTDFQPNPLYENVQEGVKLFRKETCDFIVAVGGGSAIDVAKSIKLFSALPGDGNNGSWLTMDYFSNSIPFIAMPTTAGTGSEATRYSVIYYNGNKQSITHDSCIPNVVLMDPDALITLPLYQKKVTMCDALCHAIESFWSINSTAESKELSRQAIQLIMENMDGYLTNTLEGRKNLLLAANLAGKAINITQTTAGHAMCYKITSLFGCAHGHAAILCNRILFPWMIENIDLCCDKRGSAYLQNILDEIGCAMGCDNAKSASIKLEELFKKLELDIPSATEKQFNELKSGVNPIRLKNHPIIISESDIVKLYHQILNGE